MSTALVFDIQRCSLHDGPGIRTTVFLKGCPLRCVWCHNPESQQMKPELMFIGHKCVACGACAAACPNHCHTVSNGTHTLDRTGCTLCGACVETCVYGALSVCGKQETVGAVMAVIERDRAYYEQSGGGLTVSGGEPMAHFDFTRDLLTAARQSSIHTCIETCGLAPAVRMREIAAVTDLFLYDYKESNNERHRELCGTGNELIMENLFMLHDMGAAIILRCPVVPGLNDSDEHFNGIASLEKRLPGLRGIELMAYHSWGGDKLARIGEKPRMETVETVSEETKALWIERLRALGCVKAVIG